LQVIKHFNAPELTKANLQHLETLKTLVIANGILTTAEKSQVKALLLKDKAPPQALDLVQNLIWDKLQSGELLL
jgi:hypothetical protein